GIAVLLFLGGWNTGVTPFDLSGPLGWVGNVINVVVFIVKCWLLVFVQMWVRWTLPRLRIDQVMMTCLKYLLPISCFLLLGVSVWQVALQAYVTPYFSWLLAAAVVLGAVYLIFKLATTPSKLPTPSVATPWAPTIPPSHMIGKN